MAKGNKDPNKPKRRKSAYNFFVQHERQQAENGEAAKNLLRDCADKWKNMNVEEKKPFAELAEKDKQRHQEEMLEYTPTPQKDGQGEKKSRKRKRVKDPNQPKRNMTSYFFFTKQERQNVVQENPNVSVTEVAKILGEMWSKLDEKEKEKYKEMASKDKERYEEEMKAYKNGDHVLPPSKKITLDSEVEE